MGKYHLQKIMQQVFINGSISNDCFEITGEDYHHLVNVVRLKQKEKLRVSTEDGRSYICEISDISSESLIARVLEESINTELNNKIYLFQALPKGDRMETIIEKCVELGVYEIIPVEMKNCIVKLDEKKKKSKISRYQTIAETAAKQSKRSQIPNIHEVVSFKEAVKLAMDCDLRLLPYECKNGMKDTFNALDSITPNSSIAVFIGPEGGFDSAEIEMTQGDFSLISLGKRILRTDTAAIATLTMLMLKSEELNQ